MITRIGCGGFDIDNDTLIEEDGVLKVKNGGGGGGGVLVAHDVDGTLDKTWQEISTAMANGLVVAEYTSSVGELLPCYGVYCFHDLKAGTYSVRFAGIDQDSRSTYVLVYKATEADGYPVFVDE